MVRGPCKVCKRTVAKNHKAILCGKCKQSVHIKCNNLDSKTFKSLQNKNYSLNCIMCNREELPFGSLTNTEFEVEAKFKNVTKRQNFLETSEHTCLKEKIENIVSLEENNSCKYYDIASLNSLKLDTEMSYFNLLHLNISSLSYNFEHLYDMLNQIDMKFQIIGITECKIRHLDNCKNNIELPDYTIEYTPSKSEKGGALLYLSNSLNYKVRKDLLILKDKELESVFIEILNDKSKTNTIVGCIYKHPKMNISEFLEDYLHELFYKISFEKKNVILLGDFNINLLNYDKHNETADFLDMIYSNSLLPQIVIPTRITPRSCTLIDNIFTSDTPVGTNSGNLTFPISDHLCQFLSIPSLNKKNKKKNEFIYSRSFQKFNSDSFRTELNNVNWHTELEIDKNDPNISLNKLIITFESILDRHAPMKKSKIKDKNCPKKPWMTNGIMKSINIKNNLHHKFCKLKDPIKKAETYERFKAYKKIVTNLTRKSKESYYKTFFKENKNDTMKLWNGIKEVISFNNKKMEQPKIILKNKKILTNKKEVADTFNDYFTSIASEIDQSIVEPKTKHTDYLKNPNPQSLFFNPTSQNEVENIIKQLDSRKAVGPNSLPTKLLKQFQREISNPLSMILNISYANGLFPELCKEALVIPIYKKGEQLECNNYRPISLLSNISKIFEKITFSRLYDFLNKHNCLFDLQFGFRNNHSTNHALISLTENIRKALDNKEFACGVFLDFQKAFDTVNIPILLDKLCYYGIRGTALHFFQSYLIGRKQRTKIDSSLSDSKTITYGVPQGSVLGPLLFLIYINDFHTAVIHSLTHHFADDSALLYSNVSLKKVNKYINHDLSLVVEWLRANRISLNVAKTEIILFHSKQNIPTKHLNFRVSGQKVNPVKITKYLGVYLDQNLSWEHHMKQLKTKLSRSSGLLAKLRYYMSDDLLKTVYYAIFDSCLRYGLQIWGQNEGLLFKKIEKLQEKTIRIISFKKHDESKPLFHYHRILKLTDIVKFNNCLFVFDQINSNLPEAFKYYFTTTNTAQGYNTRGTHNYHVKKHNVKTTNYGLKSIIYKSASDWNQIESKNKRFDYYTDIHNRSKFINSLKTLFLDEYIAV